MVGNFLHHAHVKPLQQRHTLGEALLKVDFATHCACGDGFHLVAHTGTDCQLVDALGLDKRRVHIEADEAAAAAVHVVLLERHVEAQLIADAHKLGLHRLLVDRIATHRKFDTGALWSFAVVGDGNTARETLDVVDVQPLLSHNATDGGNLLRSDFPAENGDDIAVFALQAHPFLVIVDGDRGVVDAHAHFCGFEKQFLHDFAAEVAGGLEKNAQRKAVVNVALTDIKNCGAEFSKNAGEGGSHTRLVVAGNADQNYFVFIVTHKLRY